MNPTLRLLLKRVGQSILVLFAVSVLVNLLVVLLPGDPAATLAGEEATPEAIALIREQLHLDRPFYEQYWLWLKDVFRGDLGDSLYTGESVTAQITARIPVTLSLGLVAMTIAIIVGVGLGVVAALRPGTLVDRSVTFVASLGVAVPSFWIGMVMISLLAVDRGWFPALGYSSFGDGPWEWLHHLLLPGFALATTPISVIARQTRGSLRDVMLSDYVRTARAKGLSRARVVAKHAGKNGAIPVVTAIGNIAGVLFGGTVVIESLFVLPGVGTMMIRAASIRDLPVIQGAVLFAAVVVLVMNLLVDLSYSYFNPKLRSR